MGLLDWLLSVLDLFGDTLDAVCTVPILAFFLAVLIFLALVSLLASLVRAGRRGRL